MLALLNKNEKEYISKHFAEADIEINGQRPWDIQIHDERFYSRLIREKTLGLGESYMDGWWDCARIDELVVRLLSANVDKAGGYSLNQLLFTALHKLFNLQDLQRAKDVALQHYDIGNTLYQAMLDPYMNYSCGYWKYAKTLDKAQKDKMELICKKLLLKPGLRLLDIGCGWGGFAKYAAENYGVEVLGITISDKQKQFADEFCRGLPVEIRLQDYRLLRDKPFDRIVSIGMFEHVGYKNYSAYMETAAANLKNEGVFLLHTIGANISGVSTDPWIDKYIFPHGMLPSITQIGQAIENHFVMEDWHNFGAYYDNTLLAWHSNFNTHWDQFKEAYGERFRRMWNYYLLCSAASFRVRRIQLWQVMLTKNGMKNGFQIRDLPPTS